MELNTPKTAHDDVNRKFIQNICRLCSTECQLKSKSILQETILQMLRYCFSINLSDTDGLPKQVCSTCLDSLKNSYIFKKQIEAADISLKEKMKTFTSKQAKLDNSQRGRVSNEKLNKMSASTPENFGLIDFIETSSKNSISNHPMGNICEHDIHFKHNDVARDVIETNENMKEIICVRNIPPLVPIEPIETSGRIISSETLDKELPPLVPLKPMLSKPSEIDEGSFLSAGIKKNIDSAKIKSDKTDISEPSKSLFCNICSKEFKDNKKLIAHLKGHMVPKNFACKICGKKYPNPSTFQIHMRSHTGERPFKCSVCNKGFTRWAGVVSHMQTHEENRPFKCNSCNQSFKILSNLERHKVLHSEVLPFCCNYCGKTFSQSANLQLHIRTYHTNERPYLCSECGKGFVSSTRLNRHMWVHTGYKPFLCKICSKAYSNSGDLRNHQSTAHGDGQCEKPYACDICDKRFFYSCRLSKHLKTHQRPYSCNVCSKSFSTSDILGQHIRTRHPLVASTNIEK